VLVVIRPDSERLPGDPPSVAPLRLGGVVLEMSPVLVVTACVAIKLLYASFVLALPDWPTQRAVGSATVGALLVMVAPVLLFPPSARVGLLLALDAVLTGVVVGDLIHVRFFRDVLSVVDVSRAGQLHMALASVGSALRPGHALLVLDVVMLGLLVPAYLAAQRPRPRLHRRGRAAVGGLLLATGVVTALPAARLVWRDPEEVFAFAITRRQVITAVGVLPYHLFDVVTNVAYPVAGRLQVSDADVEHVRRFLDDRAARQAGASPLFGAARGRNVILVMCESLQAFPLDLQIGGKPVMPALAALRRESLYFENFYDQTHMGATSDGEFTSLQSLHPLEAGAVATRYAGNHYRALPAIVADHGYATLVAIGQPGDSWNMRVMHPRLGFQRPIYEDSLAPGETIGLGLTDREFFRQMVPVLVAQRAPFLALLITLTNHHPYAIPARHHHLDVGALRGSLVGNYLQSVHYFDQALGEFVENLRLSGLLDHSVLVLYGDHHGWLEDTPDLAHLLGFAPGDSFRYWLVRKRLPLLIRLPGGAHAGTRETVAGHLDIAPTILGLLSLAEARRVMLGADLLQPRGAPVAYRDGSFSDGVRHGIRGPGVGWVGQCFEPPGGRPVPCPPPREEPAEVVQQLRVSDLIIRGDLIPALRRERGLDASGREGIR
jgi:lipoteichoic acid synthase